MTMGTAKEGTNTDDLPLHKNRARIFLGKWERRWRTEECNQGKTDRNL